MLIGWGKGRILSLLSGRMAFSSARKHVIIADPATLRNPEEYQMAITEGTCGSPGSYSPGTFLKVPVTSSFLESLKEKKDHLAFSKANNESYWMLGKAYNDSGLLGLEYLGSHASDSGLTAVVEEDPFKDASLSPVDWTEFVLTTLDEMEGTLEEMEEYALYKFFGKIPDESNEAAVFGVRCQNEPGLYETIVIKSLDNVMSSADNKTD